MFTRDTPKWLPHATANKINLQTNEGRDPASRLEHGAERIQTISDSQRKFAAQFSDLATQRRKEGAAQGRASGGSRWASKPAKSPEKTRSSPISSRWSVIRKSPEGFRGDAPATQKSPEVPSLVESDYASASQSMHHKDRLRSQQVASLRPGIGEQRAQAEPRCEGGEGGVKGAGAGEKGQAARDRGRGKGAGRGDQGLDHLETTNPKAVRRVQTEWIEKARDPQQEDGVWTNKYPTPPVTNFGATGRRRNTGTNREACAIIALAVVPIFACLRGAG